MRAMGKRANRYYQGPPSDHYDGNRFFMPGHRMANGLRELIKWQRGGGRQAPVNLIFPHFPGNHFS